jgi:hypothetical protein
MTEKKEPTSPGTGDAGSPNDLTRYCEHTGRTLRQHRRRRHASWRVVPLDCGCPDPWPCRCTDPPLSDQQIDAGRDAAVHLLTAGLIPLVQVEVRRALWRRGGADRVLAELLHEACGGEVA